MEQTVTTVVYDTHAAVRRLTGSGMPEPQAEAVVREQASVLERNLATKADADAIKASIETQRLATKTDIAGVKTEIAEVKAELKIDMAALETRLTWRLLGGMAVMLAIAVSILRLG